MDPTNDAHILVLFERLFADGEEGAGVGLHIGVVDKIVNVRAKWKLVREPNASYSSDDNRIQKLIKYLRLAKEHAKSVPQTVDLGIQNLVVVWIYLFALLDSATT
jgi:hypothetical protein